MSPVGRVVDRPDRGRGKVAGLVRRRFDSGREVWAIRFRVREGRGRGRQRRLQLGDVNGALTLALGDLPLDPDFRPPERLTLGAARDVARALAGLAAQGRDPLALLEAADRRRATARARTEAETAEGTATLAALMTRFLEARREDARPATLANWRSLAKCEVVPALGYLAPEAVTFDDVEALHQQIGATGRKITANRTIELLASLYSWAMRTRGADGRKLLTSTPCVGVRPFEERSRTRVLSSDELRSVWGALAADMVWGPAFRLLILTGARRSEVTGMAWAEVDFPAKLWRLPAERSKTGEPRSVPLSSSALALLKARRESDPRGRHVFPSPVAARGSVASLQAPFRRLVERARVVGWTIHDIRRTVRTGLAALGVRPDVAEATLGHLRPRREGVYNQYEPIPEMASALEAWAQHVKRVVAGKSAAKEGARVTPFRRRK